MNEALYPDKAAHGWLAGVAAVVVIVAVASLSGCTLQSSYVEADRRTHDRIAPDFWAYVEADHDLTDKQIQRRRDAIDSWDARITEAEGDE